MVEAIEKLKQDLTDKYVVVDPNVPELRRFDGYVGQVRTVNMNGRALVEFEAWNNIGWYDISIDCLKIVPKPEPAAEGDKHAKRAAPAKPAAAKAEVTKPTAGKPAAEVAVAGAKKLSPLEMARMQGAAKSAPAKPAPAKSEDTGAAAAGGKRSTADILAAARANKPSGGENSSPAAKSSPAEPAAKSAPQATAAATATVDAATSPAGKPSVGKASAGKPTLTPGQRPNVGEILAWCRAHDAK